MTRRPAGPRIMSLAIPLSVGCVSLLLLRPGLLRAEPRTWQYLHEVSEEEPRNIDLRTDTPRDTTLPYLPAEPYPFTPPYTAEEMGFRSMEFPHLARWNHVQIEDFGSIMPTGYLFSGKIIVLAIHAYPEGLESYLQAKPGDIFTRWLSQDTAPPENLGNQMLMLHHRTDQQFTIKTDMFGYSHVLRRVPEDFFLRPHLHRDKFPEERTITIAPEVDARIQAQDAAGHLVFAETVAKTR